MDLFEPTILCPLRAVELSLDWIYDEDACKGADDRGVLSDDREVLSDAREVQSDDRGVLPDDREILPDDREV
jgi:hypothetical protein